MTHCLKRAFETRQIRFNVLTRTCKNMDVFIRILHVLYVTDIYIMSIAIADMCICAGGGISSQLMRFMDHFPVHLAGQLIGNAG